MNGLAEFNAWRRFRSCVRKQQAAHRALENAYYNALNSSWKMKSAGTALRQIIVGNDSPGAATAILGAAHVPGPSDDVGVWLRRSVRHAREVHDLLGGSKK